MKAKKRIMRKARLNEISLVDRPAQAGAKVVLRKRDDGTPTSKKYPLEQPRLLSDVEGHSHVLDIADGAGGETSWTKSEDSEYGHSHPWVLNSDGSVSVGAADGHTHEIVPQGETDPLAKGTHSVEPQAADGGNPENSMTPEEKAAFEKAAADKLEAMTKRAERAEKVALLSDAEKELFGKMDADAQDKFLALDGAGRKAAVAKAADSDPVVYTDKDGNDFRKSDDPRMVALAKRADAERARADEAEKLAKADALAKRAETLVKNLKGDIEAKVDLMAALDSLPVAKRGPVEEILKSANALAEKVTKELGTKDEPNGDAGPDAALDAIAKSIREQNPKLSMEQAMSKALQTPEGKKAYREALEARS